MTTTLQHDSIRNLDLNSEMNLAIVQTVQPVYAFLSVQGDFSPEIGIDGMNREAFSLHQLGLELAQRGCQVDIFVRCEYPDQPEIVEHQVGFRTIRLNAGPAMVLSQLQVLQYLPTFVEAWLAFQRRSGQNYTVFQTNEWLSGWIGLQLKNQLGLPLVHTSWAIGVLRYLWLENSKIMTLRRNMERTCLEQADCVVVGSPQEVVDLRQMISIQGQIKVIPLGIDTQRFGVLSQVAARRRLGISRESRLILLT